MTRGVALSGGGLVSILAGMCSRDWLELNFPEEFVHYPQDTVLSTVSGGSIANQVYVSAGDRIWFPDYDPDVSFEDASLHGKVDGDYWFGRMSRIFGGLVPTFEEEVIANLGDNEVEAAKNIQLDALKNGQPTAGLWTAMVKNRLATYDIKPPLKAGDLEWYNTWTAVEKKSAPVKFISDTQGWIADPSGYHVATKEMISGDVYPADIGDVSNVRASILSSSFWADHIIVNKKWSLKWLVGKLGLASTKKYYFTDGGLLDESGIIPLLRRGTDSVVAFYNDNDADEAAQAMWMLGTLFGRTDVPGTQPVKGQSTSVGGPHTQVFPSEWWPEIYANLTNPLIMRAWVKDMPVLKNDWLGVEAGKLSDFWLVDNTASGQTDTLFLKSFTDPRIVEGLSDKWPTSFFDKISGLEANVLCMYQQWKGARFKSEIQEIFRRDALAVTRDTRSPPTQTGFERALKGWMEWLNL